MRRGRAIALAAAALAAGLAAAAHAAELDVAIGRSLFRRAWLPAPASTIAGLGPLFNARACVACHQGLDRPVVEVGPGGLVATDALVLRLSDEAGRPDPVYGRQIQTSATAGVAPEAAGLARDPDG
ncbi:MAG: thiol oxidoreductase, partial [Methylobacteriaceae bacterium]|nr:thiol oxidoreductase [Methylobacteriaceae bacterium]